MSKAVELFLADLEERMAFRRESKKVLDAHGGRWIAETAASLSVGSVKLFFDSLVDGFCLSVPALDVDIVFTFSLVVSRGLFAVRIRCWFETRERFSQIDALVTEVDVRRLVVSSLADALRLPAPLLTTY